MNRESERLAEGIMLVAWVERMRRGKGVVIREPFDYTKWQSELFESMSVKEVSEAAMEYRKDQKQ